MLEEEQRFLLWSGNRNHRTQRLRAAANYLSACRGSESTPVRSVLGNCCCALTETCVDDHTERRICVLRGGAVAGGQVLSSQLPLLAPRALPASGFGNRLFSSWKSSRDVTALEDEANRKKSSFCGLTVGVFNVCGFVFHFLTNWERIVGWGWWQASLAPLHLALETQVPPKQTWPFFTVGLGFLGLAIQSSSPECDQVTVGWNSSTDRFSGVLCQERGLGFGFVCVNG